MQIVIRCFKVWKDISNDHHTANLLRRVPVKTIVKISHCIWQNYEKNNWWLASGTTHWAMGRPMAKDYGLIRVGARKGTSALKIVVQKSREMPKNASLFLNCFSFNADVVRRNGACRVIIWSQNWRGTIKCPEVTRNGTKMLSRILRRSKCWSSFLQCRSKDAVLNLKPPSGNTWTKTEYS